MPIHMLHGAAYTGDRQRLKVDQRENVTIALNTMADEGECAAAIRHTMLAPDGHSKWIPLHYAAWNGHHKLAARLLVGENQLIHDQLFARNRDQNMPLHMAAMRGFPDSVTCLLGAGHALEQLLSESSGKCLPVHLAARYGMTMCAFRLLNLMPGGYKARDKQLLACSGQQGGIPLYYAFKYGHKVTCKILLKMGYAEAQLQVLKNAFTEPEMKVLRAIASEAGAKVSDKAMVPQIPALQPQPAWAVAFVAKSEWARTGDGFIARVTGRSLGTLELTKIDLTM